VSFVGLISIFNVVEDGADILMRATLIEIN
jgi:hypothetical protein